MATRNVSVTTAPKLVPGSNPGGFGDDVTILNTGTATAYLTDGAPDSTTDGQPLSAGSSLIWTEGQPLWVIAPTATTLVISENTGPIFDAGAIAAQILAQGLASQIATAINVVGVPAIDTPAVLLDTTQTCNAGVTPTDSAIFDCTRYQSLRMVFTESFNGAVGPPRQIQLGWFADAGATRLINYDLFSVPIQTTGKVFVTAPCRGPYARITSVSSASGPSDHARYVLGSFRSVAALQYDVLSCAATYSSGLVAVGAEGLSGTFAMTGTFPVGNTVDYPLTHGGAAFFMTDIFTAASGSMIIQVRDELTSRFIYTKRFAPTAGFVSNELFILPDNPVSVRIAVATAALTGNLAIVSVDKP